MENSSTTQNSYIDFLRGFGLLLLFIAHTYSPEWLSNVRMFDVPLMVTISAMCYKPLRGGVYLAYVIKRFKRIYIPVFVFLSLFFLFRNVAIIYFGVVVLPPDVIIGSFLLLNKPSIGYLWIMRVFLLIAFLMPIIAPIVAKMRFGTVLITITILICLQNLFVSFLPSITHSVAKYLYDDVFLYARVQHLCHPRIKDEII